MAGQLKHGSAFVYSLVSIHSGMRNEPKSTRDRIIEAAGKLFQAQGIRAASLDAVAAKAGLTKRTLYYHFRSKDDLIATYLQARDEPNLALFQRWFAESKGGPADKIRSVFTNLSRAARQPKWKGCGFLRTSVELVDLPGHPANVAGRAHKKRVEDWFCSELMPFGEAGEARQVARQIMLLLDGAFAVVLLHRDPGYLETAGEAAAALTERFISR
jgi:AcrR family transcriptional regulator